MADPRFFKRAGPFTLGYLADKISASLSNRAPKSWAGRLVHDVGNVSDSGPGTLIFIETKRHLPDVIAYHIGAVIVPLCFDEALINPEIPVVQAANPALAFAKAALLFYPPPTAPPAVDVMAIIHPTAMIGPNCAIGPYAVIEANASIGAGSNIAPHVVIGSGVTIGENAEIGVGVTISHAIIGRNFRVLPGTRIGQPGFGYIPGHPRHFAVPQLGRVVIGDDVEIGANTAIDRGAYGDTILHDGVIIDNLVQIAHNVELGQGVAIAGTSGIGGSAKIGDYAMLGAKVGITGHIEIGAGAQIAAGSGVARSVLPGVTVGGYPAVPIRQWHRQNAKLARLTDR